MSEAPRSPGSVPGAAGAGSAGERSSRIDAAAAVLGELAERDVPLGPYTTYRLGGPASLLVRAELVDHLRRVAEARRRSGLPVLVIGRGSNVLVADAGYPGIVVATAGLGGDVLLDGDTAELGAGLALPVAARRLAAVGMRGFEWAVGVPGSIGAAVRMNAGGHGSDMAACLISADVFDLETGELGRRRVDQLGLRFRTSNLSDRHIVVSARLRLRHGERADSEAEIAEIVRWRREHQPGGQNAGSVFVNPVPGALSAGALIDAAGLRGCRRGTAWVSEKHANFIQGSEGGSADDVRRLIDEVRAAVAEASGFVLRSEVRLVGFAPDVTVSPSTGRAA